MKRPTGFAILTMGAVACLCAASSINHAQELTEGNAASWGTFASDGRVTSATDDASHVKVGGLSIRFETASGFDTGVRYPASGGANWDLRNRNYLVYWAYSINNSVFGFQGNQPIIVLKTPTGDFRYEPRSLQMYNNVWHQYHVPLAGDATWRRTSTGSPTLANVSQIEIHQDTWDFGFVVYYDGLEFVSLSPGVLPPPGPPPPPGVNPTAIEPKVLLVIYDPIMENKAGRRMHVVYGWPDPAFLAQEVLRDLRNNSHDLARYQIVETRVVDGYPYLKDGYQYDDVSFDLAWTTKQYHQSDFDYQRFIRDHDIAPRIESGEIDEVWMYAGPSDAFRYYESTMAGDGGYWCNSGPVPGVPSRRAFVVMGWNFERGVAEAIHSYGHRFESIMDHSYGSRQPDRSNAWNHFTLQDKDAPGLGGIGNIHIPVNGLTDYDWGNTRFVLSDADDWYNYPDFQGIVRSINHRAWSPFRFDLQREYINWWYHHLPHFGGRGPDYFLNNWWRYALDVDQFKGWDGNLFFSDGLPAVEILCPPDGATVTHPVAIVVEAEANGALGRVDLYVDGIYHSSDTLSPYTFALDTAALTGDHVLAAKAYELQNGTEAVSSPITITVAPTPAPPREVSPPGSRWPLVFTPDQSLQWAPACQSGADRFNVYRGAVSELRQGIYGHCLFAGLSTNVARDAEPPPVSSCWVYLVTGSNAVGEGTMGQTSIGEIRLNTLPCP